MALLDFITKGRGVLGDRTPSPLPSWAQSMYPGGAPGTLPSGNPGGAGFSNPMLPNRAQAQPYQGNPGDGRDGGSLNGSPGQQQSQGFSMQDILAAQSGIQPHGYFDLPRQFFDPKEMLIGGAIGQFPLGGMAANQIGATYAAMSGHPRSNTDIARGFASSLPGVGGLMKLSEWYAGTPYAKNHPMQSYYMGGNGDPQAVNLSDTLWSKYGASPQTMQAAYNDLLAQKNLGGAGNPRAVEQQYLGQAQQTLDNITGGLTNAGFNPTQVQNYQDQYAKMGQNYESLLAGGPNSVVGQSVPEDMQAALADYGLNSDQVANYAQSAAQMGQDYDAALAEFNSGGSGGGGGK